MEAIIEHQGGVRFAVAARGHRLITDQPVELGGADGGMTPPELLLASLGACAAHYAAEYLRARSLPSAGLRVRVSAEKAPQPARLTEFSIDVELQPLEELRHHEGILRAVKRCLIHNTMLHPPAIQVRLHAAAAAAV